MKDTLVTKTIIFGVLILGFSVPVIPTEMAGATWLATYEINSYVTDDGLLSDTQYAEEDGSYLVRGEEGFPTRAYELEKKHTTKVERAENNIFLSKFENAKGEQVVIISGNKQKYEDLRTKRLPGEKEKKPKIKENKSILELVFVDEAEAVIKFDSRSASSWSIAVSTVTFSHTVVNANVLTVRTATSDGVDSVQSMTYNSVSLTKEAGLATSSKEVTLWYLINPDVGTYNIFVDLAAGANNQDDGLVISHGYSGVDTTDVFDTTQTGEGNGTTTLTISGHVAGGYGIDSISSSDSAITVNKNTDEGSRVSYFDAGVISMFTHDYFMKRSNRKTLDISSQDTNPTGLFWKTDGTKMYMVGSFADSIYQYSCSTAWDVTTCTYDSVSLNVSSEDTIPGDVWIKEDGTRLMTIGDLTNAIYSYTCSTAWTLSSCTYDSISTSTSLYEGTPRGLDVSSDGTKVFFTGTAGDSATRYDLSTPYNLSTASYVSAISIGTNPTDINVIYDGHWIDSFNPATGEARLYFCTTAYDTSTCLFNRTAMPRADDLVIDVAGSFLPADQQNYYMVSPATDLIYQYENLSATTTTNMGINNPSGNEYWIAIGGILKPLADSVGGVIDSGIIWFNED